MVSEASPPKQISENVSSVPEFPEFRDLRSAGVKARPSVHADVNPRREKENRQNPNRHLPRLPFGIFMMDLVVQAVCEWQLIFDCSANCICDSLALLRPVQNPGN